jgi:hypothetical protein
MTIIAKPLLLCLKTLRISTINEKWLPLARKVEKKGNKNTRIRLRNVYVICDVLTLILMRRNV